MGTRAFRGAAATTVHLLRMPTVHGLCMPDCRASSRCGPSRVPAHEDRLLQHQRRQGPPARAARLAARRRAPTSSSCRSSRPPTTSSPASRSRTWATTLKPMGKRASTASPSSRGCRSRTSAAACPATTPTSRPAGSRRPSPAIRVCGLYLPNGNPAPGPKYDYKLAWMDRLHARAEALIADEETAVILGDYNVIPEPRDCWDPAVWAKRRALPARDPRRLPPPRAPRPDRRAPRRRPGPGHLHLLGLPGRRLPEELGHPHRPRAPDPAGRRPARDLRHRRRDPLAREALRPRPDLGHARGLTGDARPVDRPDPADERRRCRSTPPAATATRRSRRRPGAASPSRASRSGGWRWARRPAPTSTRRATSPPAAPRSTPSRPRR